jgi:hypothetical protein
MNTRFSDACPGCNDTLSTDECRAKYPEVRNQSAWDLIAAQVIGINKEEVAEVSLTDSEVKALILGEAKRLASADSFEEFAQHKQVMVALLNLHGTLLLRNESGL